MVLITELLGFAAALCIGLIFGLIGAGGSILAVPVLAYFFGFDEKITTAYSLFVVGSSAVVGAFRQHLNRLVRWNLVWAFGISTVIAVTLVRRYLIPALPDVIFESEGFVLSRRLLIFGLFALLMIPTAFHMLKSPEPEAPHGLSSLNYPLIFFQGLAIGGLTGLVGAGGGFMIVPALIYMSGIDMKSAAGTSMAIIAINALTGFFLGDAVTVSIDWSFLFSFTVVVMSGLLMGIYLGNFVQGSKLKRAFGLFVLLMSSCILSMEIITIQSK